MEACEHVQNVFLIPEATRMFNRRSGFQRHADYMHAQTNAVWKEILIINHIADDSSLLGGVSRPEALEWAQLYCLAQGE